MKKYISIFIFLFSCIIANCQINDSIPLLTKQQMYDDFDFFLKIIKDVNPQIEFRKEVQSLDIIQELNKLRKNIDTITNSFEFFNLIFYALNICQDGHISLVYPEDVKYVLLLHPENLPENERKGLLYYVDTNKINTGNKYILAWNNYLQKKIKPISAILPFYYINGDYVSITSFKYKEHKFPKGIKLIKCNSEDIHNVVNQKISKDYNLLKWDDKNKRFFMDRFIPTNSLFLSDTLKLTLYDENKKKIYNECFSLSDNCKWLHISKLGCYFDDNNTGAKYFSKGHVLYIRLESMEMQDALVIIDEIKKNASTNKIKKVIINIRNNFGGNDLAWVTILQAIIDKPIINNYKMVIKKSETNLKYLNITDDKIKIEKIPFLKGNEYIIYNYGEDTIKPSKESIMYSGNIYLLQNRNVYSSAGALSALALYTDRIVSIGENSGWVGGLGVTPFYFMLRNSNIVFRISPSLDITNVKNNNDFLNRVEIKQDITINDYFNGLKSIKPESKHYLYKKNPLFIKALQLQ